MNRRILIADDDRIQIRLLQKVLGTGKYQSFLESEGENASLEVEAFDDGAPLVKHFYNEFQKGSRIPLCILDMRMITLGGLETAEAVREIDHEVFIIIITSYEDIKHGDLMKSLKKDVYFMRKPLRTEELLAQVKSLLISWNNNRKLKEAYREKDRTWNRLQTILNHSPTIIVQQDLNGKYELVNRRFSDVFGLTSDEVLGRTDALIFPPATAEVREKYIRRVVESQNKIEFEENIRINGKVRTYLTAAYPICDEKGDIEGVGAMSADITERKIAETDLQEKQDYLDTIMKTIQTGVLIIDPETYCITDANPCTCRMLGFEKKELLGRDFYDFRHNDDDSEKEGNIVRNSYMLKTREKKPIHVRRSLAKAKSGGREYLVQSMLDITDIQELMKKQEISIDLAKHLLFMINGRPQRHTELSDDLMLFVETFSAPCLKEGGDHFFTKTLTFGNGRSKTAISLKDQSGHEVGCVLRSIATDLVHHGILDVNRSAPPDETTTMLNREIFRHNIFRLGDFFTAVTAEIDHRTLEFRFVSSGHPRFMLIRGKEIIGLPERNRDGGNSPIPFDPDARFSSGTMQLRAGDRLILYTDGLVEMPRASGKSFLTFDELSELAGRLIRRNPCWKVSDIMRGVLNEISAMSNVEVTPLNNSSLDDITILCIEIESRLDSREITIRCKDTQELFDIIDDISEKIFSELELNGFGNRESAVRSVLSEGIMNAWAHGNMENPEKCIIVRWRCANDFHLEIIDEGEGFDADNIPDPKMRENILKCSGRGVYIIRRFSDTAKWEDGGRRMAVSIAKNPDSIESKGAVWSNQVAYK